MLSPKVENFWRGDGQFGTVNIKPYQVSAEIFGGHAFSSVIPPMDVELRFETPKQIAKHGNETYAFTYLNSKPCRIVMPAGAMLYGMMPEWPHARFAETSYADVLAHELLHCIDGDWHPRTYPFVSGLGIGINVK
jgi:hypothetical protein